MDIRIQTHIPARIVIAAVLSVAIAAPVAAAAPDALVAKGELIAQRQCSACHTIGPRQDYPRLLRQATPSFMDIAKRPGISEKALAKVISGKHWDLQSVPMTMPDQQLSPREARAVARYILSLGKQP